MLPLADSQSTYLRTDRRPDRRSGRPGRTRPRADGWSAKASRYAEAAIPLSQGFVLVLRAPLEDTLSNVELVRRRLLLAGVVALLLSLALGYGAAYLFARRLRRLERAADRIASGRFDEPIVDRGGDEVGQLAAAFDRMRLRLAGLERARREFIANASHELRTPIFSLGGFLELLDDEDLDEETRKEFLGTAREQVTRLTKLATDLLDLSRLDAGRVQLERETLDLGALARSICREFEAVARSKRHELETVLDGSADAVGDEQRTIQIGRILVENALLHTPPGTTVRIRTGRENGRAVLEVEDEGPGIAADAAGPGLRPLLPGRRRHHDRERAGSRDREGARGADGWSDRAGVQPPAPRCSGSRCPPPPSRISVENGPVGPWLQWPDAPGIRRVGLAGHRAPRRLAAIGIGTAAGWIGDTDTVIVGAQDTSSATRPRLPFGEPQNPWSAARFRPRRSTRRARRAWSRSSPSSATSRTTRPALHRAPGSSSRPTGSCSRTRTS